MQIAVVGEVAVNQPAQRRHIEVCARTCARVFRSRFKGGPIRLNRRTVGICAAFIGNVAVVFFRVARRRGQTRVGGTLFVAVNADIVAAVQRLYGIGCGRRVPRQVHGFGNFVASVVRSSAVFQVEIDAHIFHGRLTCRRLRNGHEIGGRSERVVIIIVLFGRVGRDIRTVLVLRRHVVVAGNAHRVVADVDRLVFERELLAERKRVHLFVEDKHGRGNVLHAPFRERERLPVERLHENALRSPFRRAFGQFRREGDGRVGRGRGRGTVFQIVAADIRESAFKHLFTAALEHDLEISRNGFRIRRFRESEREIVRDGSRRHRTRVKLGIIVFQILLRSVLDSDSQPAVRRLFKDEGVDCLRVFGDVFLVALEFDGKRLEIHGGEGKLHTEIVRFAGFYNGGILRAVRAEPFERKIAPEMRFSAVGERELNVRGTPFRRADFAADARGKYRGRLILDLRDRLRGAARDDGTDRKREHCDQHNDERCNC